MTGREKCAVDGTVDGDGEVGIVEHDQGILAAHFELEFGTAARTMARNLASGCYRTRKAQAVNSRVLKQSLADNAARPHDEVEDTRRQRRTADDIGQCPGAARHQAGGLEDDAIAIRQCRRDFPGRNRDREVPRRDDADDADRFPADLDLDAGANRCDGLTAQPERFTGKKLEYLAGTRRLAYAFVQRLALFAGQQPAQFFLAGEYFGADGIEGVESLLDTALRPAGKRFGGGRQSGLDLLRIGLRIVADDVAGIRWIDIVDVTIRAGPLAGDVVCKVRHVCPPKGFRVVYYIRSGAEMYMSGYCLRTVRTVDSHAQGNPTRVIVGGGP